MSDYYKLDRTKKGFAIIINNLHNEQKATRNDVSKLETMFNTIGVQVILNSIKHFSNISEKARPLTTKSCYTV
jgi:hypothetical protein